MKALISPQQDNYVVQVEPDNKIFEIGLPLYWIKCPDYIVAYDYYYIPETNEFILIEKMPPVEIKNASEVFY
jgi:hypothetical protein